jgi:hypothetical protein
MGFLISLGFGLLGAAITNYLLRDKLGGIRIALSILAGVGAGIIINAILTVLIYRAAGQDWSLFAIVGTIGGPACTALAAWRWRPRVRAPGDLRS